MVMISSSRIFILKLILHIVSIVGTLNHIFMSNTLTTTFYVRIFSDKIYVSVQRTRAQTHALHKT